MRTLLFLLLCWGLGLGRLAAQSRAAGPWRVVRGPVRVRNAYERWNLPDSDTTTSVIVKRQLLKSTWNIHPDSIRLFLNCKNPLIAPSTKASIRFAASGATLRLDARQRLLWLAPSDSVVVLRAYRGQRLVFRHEFRAVAPPAPSIKYYLGDSRYADDVRPENEGKHRSVTLKALPAGDFQEFMPEDARYRVAQYRVTLVRADNIGPTLLINEPQGDIRALNFIDELGGKLQVDILLVQRQNFRGEIFGVSKLLKNHFIIPSEKP